MLNNSLLEQFRSFYFRNYPDDMEIQIEYFSIFGGLGWDIDTSKEITFLLQDLVLDNFEMIDKQIQELISLNSEQRRLLRALAVGDRRIFSAFNKAGLNNQNGGVALNQLEDKGLIQIEFSREEPAKSLNPKGRLKRTVAKHRISHKVLFTYPFLRFWFYFIVPHVNEIIGGEYDNFFKDFNDRKNSYTSLVFEELSEVLLNYNLRDSQIISSGSYWDANIEIDILTITEDEKVYAAECKWTNHQINKKELHKLKEKCEKLDIDPNQMVFFSKRGFSKELVQNQGKELALYTCSDFKALVQNAKTDELIEKLIN